MYIFSSNCRDFLFLTSYKSERYCQELDKLTESQTQARDLEERQYLELEDDEMDIWLKLTPTTLTEGKDLFDTLFMRGGEIKQRDSSEEREIFQSLIYLRYYGRHQAVVYDRHTSVEGLSRLLSGPTSELPGRLRWDFCLLKNGSDFEDGFIMVSKSK